MAAKWSLFYANWYQPPWTDPKICPHSRTLRKFGKNHISPHGQTPLKFGKPHESLVTHFTGMRRFYFKTWDYTPNYYNFKHNLFHFSLRGWYRARVGSRIASSCFYFSSSACSNLNAFSTSNSTRLINLSGKVILRDLGKITWEILCRMYSNTAQNEKTVIAIPSKINTRNGFWTNWKGHSSFCQRNVRTSGCSWIK